MKKILLWVRTDGEPKAIESQAVVAGKTGRLVRVEARDVVEARRTLSVAGLELVPVRSGSAMSERSAALTHNAEVQAARLCVEEVTRG